jgi:FtsZ-interacting cell division protein ZipA
METRTLAIGLVAIVAAFAAAFGVARSGGSETETAGAGVKAQSIQVAAPAAVSGVELGGTLPALKAERKAKKKKQPASNTNASEPSTSDSPDSAVPDTSTQPSNPQPSNPQPSNPEPSNPQPSNPEPSTPKQSDPPPVSSGGDDG